MIWRIERDGISAIKFEAARLHIFFLVTGTQAGEGGGGGGGGEGGG